MGKKNKKDQQPIYKNYLLMLKMAEIFYNGLLQEIRPNHIIKQNLLTKLETVEREEVIIEEKELKSKKEKSKKDVFQIFLNHKIPDTILEEMNNLLNKLDKIKESEESKALPIKKKQAPIKPKRLTTSSFDIELLKKVISLEEDKEVVQKLEKNLIELNNIQTKELITTIFNKKLKNTKLPYSLAKEIKKFCVKLNNTQLERKIELKELYNNSKKQDGEMTTFKAKKDNFKIQTPEVFTPEDKNKVNKKNLFRVAERLATSNNQIGQKKCINNIKIM